MARCLTAVAVCLLVSAAAWSEPPEPIAYDVPVIGEWLGRPAEDLRLRLLDADEHGALLERRRVHTFRQERFALSAGGADVVGFEVQDELVTGVSLYYRSERSRPMGRLLDELGAWDGDGPIETIYRRPLDVDPLRLVLSVHDLRNAKRGDEPYEHIRIAIEIHPVDLYLRSHEVEPKLEAAMKAGRVVEGMTLAQANMVMDQEGKMLIERGDEARYRWTESAERQVAVRGTNGALEPARIRIRTHEVYATVRDGVVTDVVRAAVAD